MNEERIISYLNGEMNPQEIQAFESDLKSDASLLDEFNQYKNITESVKHYSRNELKVRLKRIEESNSNTRSSSKILILILLLSAILTTIAVYYYSKEKAIPVQKDNPLPVIDSTQIQRNFRDTSSINEIPENVVPKIETSQPIASDNRGSEEELFAAHFVPYSDEFMEGEVRGSGEISPYEKFQKLYTEKKYTEAVKQFEFIDASLKENGNVLFFYANALLASNHPKEAMLILNTIINENESRYVEQAKMLMMRLKRFKR